jgi:hypothetical protein
LERIQKLESLVEEYQKTLDEALANTTTVPQKLDASEDDVNTILALKTQVETLTRRNSELDNGKHIYII